MIIEENEYFLMMDILAIQGLAWRISKVTTAKCAQSECFASYNLLAALFPLLTLFSLPLHCFVATIGPWIQ